MSSASFEKYQRSKKGTVRGRKGTIVKRKQLIRRKTNIRIDNKNKLHGVRLAGDKLLIFAVAERAFNPSQKKVFINASRHK